MREARPEVDAAAEAWVRGVDTPTAWAMSTTAANGARFSTAFRCARLARLTQAGSAAVGATL